MAGLEKASHQNNALPNALWNKFKRHSHALSLFLALNILVGQGVTSCEKKNYNAAWDEIAWRSWSLPQNDTLASRIEVVRDAGVVFYRVQDDDTLEKIWKKLQEIEEFSYLKEHSYQPKDEERNIRGFNIPWGQLKKGLLIPIPLKEEKREIPLAQFRTYSREAIQILRTHEKYGPLIEQVIAQIGVEELANLMCAFALSESAEQKPFGLKSEIWSLEFHRWEQRYECFSFSPYHILMEKNADGKSLGPGLRAKKNLWKTEGHLYHPRDAGELFLAYWIEKVPSQKLVSVLKITSLTKAKKAGKLYNGSSQYGEKLRSNLSFVRRKFH